MKKNVYAALIFIIIAVWTLFSFNVAHAQDIYGNGNRFMISGQCNYSQGNVMLLVVKKDAAEPYSTEDIGYINNVPIDSNGRYYSEFSFNQNPDRYKVMVKVGEDDVTSGIIEMVSRMTVTVEQRVDGNIAEINLNTTNNFSNFTSYVTIAGSYDSDGKLLKANKLGNEVVDGNAENSHTYYLPVSDDTAYIKIFTWNSINGMKSYADKAETEVEQFWGTELFVSPNGSDSAPGTIDEPLKSFEAARNAVRKIKKDEPITVYFRGGTYNISKNISLDSIDSGTADAPITYTAYKNEQPEFAGGVYIDGGKFVKSEDMRFSNKNIYCLDLAKEGLEQYIGDVQPGGQGAVYNAPNMELFIDDKAYELARWPNRDSDGFNTYCKIQEVISGGDENENDSELPSFIADDNVIERIKTWSDISDVICSGYLGLPYFDFDFKMTSINGNQINLNKLCNGGIQKDGVFYFYNIAEELDHDGEYFIDRENKKLYIYMESGDLKDKTIFLTTFDTGNIYNGMLNINNAKYINFNGLCLNGSRGNGIALKRGAHINFANCTVKNVSARGIYASEFFGSFKNAYGELDDESYDMLVHDVKFVGCKILNTGYCGISVYGGDRKTLESANVDIYDCKFENFGRIIKTYSPAIDIKGVGINVRNSEIHRGDSMGMLISGNDITVENNEIYDVIREATDSGMIYSAAGVKSGVIIRNNYFHDIDFEHGSGFTMEWNKGVSVPFKVGVYNDCGGSLMQVENNIFKNIPSGYFSVGFGNEINNNIFVDVIYPLAERYNNILQDRLYNPVTGKYDIVIDFTKATVDDSMAELGLLDEQANVQWMEKYPEVFEWKKYLKKRGILAVNPKCDMSDNLITFINYTDYAEKVTDIFSDKLVYRKEDLINGESNIDNIIFDRNVQFNDAQKGDFRIKEGSEILKKLPGLRNITI